MHLIIMYRGMYYYVNADMSIMYCGVHIKYMPIDGNQLSSHGRCYYQLYTFSIEVFFHFSYKYLRKLAINTTNTTHQQNIVTQ